MSADPNVTLMWLDLEMTGLDAQNDFIVEAAAITTGWDLALIDQFETGVKNTDRAAFAARVETSPWFRQQGPEYTRQIVELEEFGMPIGDVEQRLLDMLPTDGDVFLAGNSIHTDLAFVQQYWTRLTERLHYRLLDVSSFKLWLLNARGVEEYQKDKAHRALDDIKESIAEFKYYDSLMFDKS